MLKGFLLDALSKEKHSRMKSVLKKFTDGLAKTRDSLFGSVRRALKAKSVIDEELLQTIEEALLSADVGPATTERMMSEIRAAVRSKGYESTKELGMILRSEVEKMLGEGKPGEFPLQSPARPHVILVVGVNGAGKTTTVGKLAHLLRSRGLKVIIGAADTFRAAANEQLEVWARRADAELVQQASGSDPASVAFDTLSSAMAKKADVVLIDTAGRLHTKSNLMEELKKVRRVLSRVLEGAPHECLLVLDATTGQNGLQQAKQFMTSAGVTGIVLTKIDGTAKGGVILGISHELGIPVRFVGVGEGVDDLQPFDRSLFVEALFRESGLVESKEHAA